MEAAEAERPTPGRESAPTPKGGAEATPKTKRSYVKLPPGRKLELLKMLDAGVSKEVLMKEFSVSRTTLYLYKMNIDKMKHQLMTSLPGGSGGPRRKRKRRTRLGWKKVLPQTDDEEMVISPKVEPHQPEEETKPETPPIEEPLPPPQPPPPPSESAPPSPSESDTFQPLLPPPLAPAPVTNHSRRGKRKRKSINLPRKHSKNRWFKLCQPIAGVPQLSTITAAPKLAPSSPSFPIEDTGGLDQTDKFKGEGRTRASTSTPHDSSTAPRLRPLGQPAHMESGIAGGKGDQLHVQHNFHSQKILEVLTCDETFIDVTLTAEGRSVRAHKLILSAMSPYFQEVLQTNPCQHPVIIMPRTVRFSHLTQIIDFIYRGEITLPEEELRSLLNTAEHLQISGFSTPEIMKLLGETPSGSDNTTLTPTASTSHLTHLSEEMIHAGRSVEVELDVEPVRGIGRGRVGLRRGRGGRRTRGGRRGRGGRGGRMKASEDIISSCGQRLVRASQYSPPISTSLSPSRTPSPSLPPLPASPEPSHSPQVRLSSTRAFQRMEGGQLRHPVDDLMSCTPGTVLGMDVDIDIVKEEVLSESEDNVSEAGENMVFIVEGESLLQQDSHHSTLTCGTLQATPMQTQPPPLFTTATQPLLPRTALFSSVVSGSADQAVSIALPHTVPATTLAPTVPLFGGRFHITSQPVSQGSQGINVASISSVSHGVGSPAPPSNGSYMVTSPASPSEASFEAASPAPQSEASYAMGSPGHHKGPSATSPAPHSESSYEATSPTLQSEASMSDEEPSSPHDIASSPLQAHASDSLPHITTEAFARTSPIPTGTCSLVTLQAPPSTEAISQPAISPIATSRAPASPIPAPPSPMDTSQVTSSPKTISKSSTSPMTSQASKSPTTTSQTQASPISIPQTSPSPVTFAPHSPMTSLLIPSSPITISQTPHSPMTTSQTPPSPIITCQASTSPMTTSQTPCIPMSIYQAPCIPMTKSACSPMTFSPPPSPVALPPLPSSPTPTSQPLHSPTITSLSPQQPLHTTTITIQTSHSLALTSQPQHSPTLTSQTALSPRLTSQPAYSPITTSQPSQSPIPTSQPPQSPIPTSQPPHIPIPTSQPPKSPIPTSQHAQSPISTSQPHHSPIPTSQSSHSPVPTSQPQHSPISTSQPLHSPIPTSQSPLSPIPTSQQAPLSPILTSQSSLAPLLISQPSHSPMLTSQSTPNLTLTSQSSHSPTLTIHPLCSPMVTKAVSNNREAVGAPVSMVQSVAPQQRDTCTTTSPPPPVPPLTCDAPLTMVKEACSEAASSPTTGLRHQTVSSSPPPPPHCRPSHPSPQGKVTMAGSPPHPEAGRGSVGPSPPTQQSPASPCVAASLPHTSGSSGVLASPPHKATTDSAALLSGGATCLASQQPTVSTPSSSPLLSTACTITTATSTASPPQHCDDLAPEISSTPLRHDLSGCWGANQYQPSCETIPLQYPETSSLHYSSDLGSFQISHGQYSGLGYQTNAPPYQPSYETISGQYGEPSYEASPPHYTKLGYSPSTPQYVTPVCQTSPLQQYQPNFEASTLQYSDPPALDTLPTSAPFSMAGCEPRNQPTVAAPATSPTLYYDPSCPDSPHHLQYSQL
ncbi:flocculation protein FLO11-like [Portunus trituberculatus]|uniref:flocculation protein FLO11-like n=1 Tax=Portunus trituberculatus TaxID=210409 RepID=UPI001E1CCBE1|nr:flocculation protein FLO11-like [Portunus trituberculatus]